MTTPIHLDKCIICPKCQTKTMRKAIPQKFGMEYFDDKCHTYFGVNELVNNWGYDASELFPYYPVTHSVFKRNKLVEMDYAEQEKNLFTLPEHSIRKLNLFSWDYNTVSDLYEGEWRSKLDRDLAYEEVTVMQLGIPSWSMEDYSVDTGATFR